MIYKMTKTEYLILQKTNVGKLNILTLISIFRKIIIVNVLYTVK